MKRSNIYNLATSLELYKNRHLQQLAHQNQMNMPTNIFNQLELQKCTEKELQSLKHYQIVGGKDLKSLELRARKCTKLGFKRSQSQRDVCESNRPKTLKKDDLKTKQEILLGLPKIDLKIKINGKLKERKRQSWMTEFTDMQFQSKMTLKAQKFNMKDNEFSVSRLRELVQEKKKQWGELKKNEKENEKFPSIYKSSELYRSNVEQRLKRLQTQNMTIQRSSLWQKTLRNNKNIGQLAKGKQIAKTFHDEGEFTAKGISKLRMQKEWLAMKQVQGYMFKMLVSEGKGADKGKIETFR